MPKSGRNTRSPGLVNNKTNKSDFICDTPLWVLKNPCGFLVIGYGEPKNLFIVFSFYATVPASLFGVAQLAKGSSINMLAAGADLLALA